MVCDGLRWSATEKDMPMTIVVTLDTSPKQISNTEFLRAVFQGDWRRAHVCGFREDPTTLDSLGLRGFWAGGEAQHMLPFPVDANTFFTISTFHPDPISGWSRRRKVQFDRSYVIVIDDVGLRGLDGTSAKVPVDKVKLPPSYAIETSPGNWQLGYILDGGDSRGGKVVALLDAMVAQGLVSDGSDPGMKGVTRYVRLPVGRNTKAKYGSAGHVHVLGSWRPERTYTLEQIADAYGCRKELDAAEDALNAPVAGSFDPGQDQIAEVLVNAGQVQSFDEAKKLWQVTCPFVEDHTGRADSGTAYLGEGRWCCHHGHCEQRDHWEFTDKLRALFPDEWAAVTRAGLELDGEASVSPSREVEDIFGVENVERFQEIKADVVEKKAMGPFQKRMDAGRVDVRDVAGWSVGTDIPAVLKGLIPRVGMGVLYGASGIGKSFVAMDLVLRLAAGQDWNGHRNKAEDGVWVYISSEGGRDELMRRLRGWQDEHGALPGNVAFHAVSMSWGTGEAGEEDVRNFLKWCRLLGSPVRGVVIDTLNRNMLGDENSTADMTGFVNSVDKIWRALGCVVPVVHHEGKDAAKGARGSSVLKGAAEFEWRIFRDQGSMRGGVFVEKNRHGQDGMTFGFELKVVDLGADSDGDPVTTLVVQDAKPPANTAPLTRKYSKCIVQAYETMGASGWVDMEALAKEAQDIFSAEYPGDRVPSPSAFKREMREYLAQKHGWDVLDDAICPPHGEQDG